MKKTFRFYCLTIFTCTFLLVFFSLQLLVKSVSDAHREETNDQTEIILSNVSSRLKIFMDLPLMLGRMGADHFKEYTLNQKNLDKFCEGISQINRDILGLNLLNAEGKIIGVFPVTANSQALGKSTQNLSNLRTSIKNKEEFWFSQPFDLYQKSEGFAIYVPILKGNLLRGWFAVVMNTQSFVHDFNLDKLMKHFEINIIDDQSRQPFLQTSMFSTQVNNKRIFSEKVHGRDLNYVIWPKKTFKSPIHTSGIIIISFVISILAVIFASLIEFRRRTHRKLNDMNNIMKLAHREAMMKLVDLQAEIYKLGADENIKHIYQMIEQLEIIQNSFHTNQEIDEGEEEIVSAIRQEIKEQSPIIKKKNLFIHMMISEEDKVHFRTNKWLFRNSVINNIITHSLLLSSPGTNITISLNSLPQSCVFLFRLQQTLQYVVQGEVQEFDKHLEVAKRVMSYYEGDVTADKDLAGGLLIRVYIPKEKDVEGQFFRWVREHLRFNRTAQT